MKIDVTPAKFAYFENLENGTTVINPLIPEQIWMKMEREEEFGANCVDLSRGVQGTIYNKTPVGPGCLYEVINLKLVRDES